MNLNNGDNKRVTKQAAVCNIWCSNG